MAADTLRQNEPDKALAVLDGAVALTSDVQPELYAMLSTILLHEGKSDEVRRRLSPW